MIRVFVIAGSTILGVRTFHAITYDEEYKPEKYKPETFKPETINRPHEPNSKSNEPNSKANEPNSKANEPNSKANEPNSKANEPNSKANEPNSKVDEPIGNKPDEDFLKDDLPYTNPAIILRIVGGILIGVGHTLIAIADNLEKKD